MTDIKGCACGDRQQGREITVQSHRGDPTKWRQYLCANCGGLISVWPERMTKRDFLDEMIRRCDALPAPPEHREPR